MSYIDALRKYNAGMTSWCLPRKGTVGYETLMKIRRGDTVETPKQIMDRLERKTTGRGRRGQAPLRGGKAVRSLEVSL